MPKKSSKKGSKKQIPAAETTLVPRDHRAPNLTDLLELAKGGKLSDVQQYLNAGGSPNVLQRTEHLGLVPLLFSVAKSWHSVAAASIKLLLEAGAAVNAVASSPLRERTALLAACSIPNNLQAVQALLHGGADAYYQSSSDGISALHLAAAAGCIDSCRALHTASSGRAAELMNKVDKKGVTPLMMACVMKQYAVVELLCALGVDVNASSTAGTSSLMAAVDGHSTSLLQCLLQQDGIKVNHRAGNGNTALIIAVESDNVAAVKLLLQHGADACNINNSGYSAVFAAVAGGHLQVLKLLLQHGAAITATADPGFTLLMQAARSNQPRVAEFLIESGFLLHAVSGLGFTALHYAAASTISGTETMHVLLAHGADCTALGSIGSTALHAAANGGQSDKVRVLIAAGADVLSRCDAGATALHLAIEKAHFPVVKLLLEHGADAVLNTMLCRLCESCGHVSALMMCEDTTVLKLLLTAGADVLAASTRGYTSLHVAARHNFTASMVCLLIKAGADLHAVNSDGKTAAEVAHDSGNTLIEQLLIRAAQQA
jgi:uncharacterized protein